MVERNHFCPVIFVQMSALKFLLLEVYLPDVEAVISTLTAASIDYEMVRVDTRANLIKALSTAKFDLILADYARN